MSKKISGFALGCLSLLGCICAVALGAVLGAVAMNGTAPPGLERLDATISGAAVGSVIGLVCGVGILVMGYRASRKR